MNIFVIQNDGRTIIAQHGQQLNISNLYLADQQYYACGITLNAKLNILNQYFLFVRGNLFRKTFINLINLNDLFTMKSIQ